MLKLIMSTILLVTSNGFAANKNYVCYSLTMTTNAEMQTLRKFDANSTDARLVNSSTGEVTVLPVGQYEIYPVNYNSPKHSGSLRLNGRHEAFILAAEVVVAGGSLEIIRICEKD